MPNPLSISVITPSFNQARFIRATIESVLEQGLCGVEHIVVDGGSTDGTVEILKEYGHLKWVSEPDQGQADAINKGFAMSTGQIIAWINSDDVYAPEALRKVREFFTARPEARIVCGNTVVFDEDGQVMLHRPPKLEAQCLRHPWRHGSSVFQQGTLFRREVFAEFGPLNIELHYGMDYDLFLRATEKYAVHHLAEDLGCFRVYAESKTGEGWENFHDEDERTLFDYLRTRSPARAYWARFRMHVNRARRWLGQGIEAHEAGERQEARRLFRRAYGRNPFIALSYSHLCFRLRQLCGKERYERLRASWRKLIAGGKDGQS